MRRKFISALLFGALVAASTSTFVSCKDYDDDINGLQGQITANASTLEELVTEKVNNLTTEINALKQEDARLNSALEAAKADLAAAIEEAKTAAGNAEAAAKAYADEKAAAAQVAAIEAAKQAVADAQALLQAGIDDANAQIAAISGKVTTQEEQIAGLLEADAALQTALETANANIAAAQSTADEALAAAEAAQGTADQNAATLAQIVENLATVKAELDEQISILGDKVDQAVADIAANKADADAKLAQVNSLIESNTKAIEALQAKDTELAGLIAENTADLLELADQLTQVQAACAANLTAAKAYADAQVAALRSALGEDINKVSSDLAAALVRVSAAEEAISGIQEALKGQETVNENVSESITAMQGDIDELWKTVLDNADAVILEIGDINKQIESINGTMKTNSGDIKALQETAAGLQKQLEEQQSSIDEAKQSISGLTQKVKDYISSNDQALEVLKTTLNDNFSAAIEAQGKTLREEIEQKASELSTALTQTITAGDNALKDQIDDLRLQIGALSGDQSVVELIDEKIEAANGRIDDVQNSISDLDTKIQGQLADINGELDLIVGEIGIIWQQLFINYNNELARLAGVSKQLKSLVFCPTTYVNGIECIKFATLQYTDWGTSPADWEADAANKSNKSYVIDDAQQYEEYFANPRNVDKSDITKLEFVSNQATNTRAVSPNASVAIADWDLGLNENGAFVMKLNLKKTTDASFGDDKDKFTIVALKATLNDKFLTDEQKANGEKVEVYSDWARLYETSETPRIHNALKVDKNDKLITNDPASHFWKYSEVYNGGSKEDEQPTGDNQKYIATEVYYADTLDLRELVLVCDNSASGTIYDEEKYGLDYEFHVMDYILDNSDNSGSAVDATNQKHFAKLLDDGHRLVSTARNGVEQNRDAIGRQPMIQVVLKDVRDPENVKVVDVRYFKVKWVDKTVVDNIGQLGETFERDYLCGSAYSDLILKEEVLNGLYTKYNMSRNEFHASYDLNWSLFATAEDAQKGQNPVSSLGQIRDLADDGEHGQTHNLQWTINTNDNAATQAEYEKGYKEIVAYGYYKSKTNAESRIVFSLKLKLKIETMDYAKGVGKDQTMWKDGARFVNPQLETDGTYGNDNYETTMILGSFLKGYINDGQTPASVADLININADDATFAFDESKLGELASATGTQAADWSISANGRELSYNGTQAAFIVGDRIQLSETNISFDPAGNTGSEATAAAKLLVGKYAPVKLSATWCELNEVIDQYNVSFLAPLAFNNPAINLVVEDITAGGDQSTSFAKAIQIEEAFTTNKRTVYVNGGTTNTELVEWYGVKDPVYDIANAMTNIQKDGTIGSACNVRLSDIRNSDGTPKYTVSVDDAKNVVKFYNMSGNAIGQEFKIEIPVTVETKWQTMTAKIVVTVKPAI